jgi:hypothetical protein
MKRSVLEDLQNIRELFADVDPDDFFETMVELRTGVNMPDTKHKDPTKREEKSTSEPFSIIEIDEDDVLIIKIDRKDPARRRIMAVIQTALEADQRTDEAVRAKAYAQEKLPDDWQRKWPSREDPNVKEPRRAV